MKQYLILLSIILFSSALPLKKQVGVTPAQLETWIGSFLNGFGFENYVTPAPNCSAKLVSFVN